MCRLENALKRHCPRCCLPYFDTRLDCHLTRPRESAVWTSRHFGHNWGPVRDGMAADWSPATRDCDLWGNGVINRYTDANGCWRGLQYTDAMIRRITTKTSYDDMCLPYDSNDFERDHGRVHVYINGHMGSLACSPCDPVFYLHHCFVDNVGERLKDRLPSSRWTYPTDTWWMPWDHAADDRMWPFDLRNADALDDEKIGKDYIYEASPADEPCSTDGDCSPLSTRLLWCDRGVCKAKCREEGSCTTGVHAMCYCEDDNATPRCDAGTCSCETTQTNLNGP